MYQIFREWVSMWIVDILPTQNELADLNCDSYEEYVDIESVETEEKKKSRIYQSLITSPDIQSVKLEWIIFNDKEIGDIILERVFGGNPHAESALQAKISAYIISVMSGKTNDEILISIKDKQEKINEIRLKFGLTII